MVRVRFGAAARASWYDPRVSAISAGRRIGSYILVERLGRGGMGVVWRARDPDLEREVAIKMMTSGEEHTAVEEELAQRFLLEARAAARIQSRHVVQVMQLGRTEQGEVFIVMELLKGRSLHAVLREGAIPPPRALRIARQLARGMAAAHALGVVHRDLKPANVMLAELDGEETAKILDFGVAKLTKDGGRGLTQNGAMIGTVPYMAPEQVLGEPVDGRTDVYALGVVLFRMLTGEHLYDSDVLSDLLRHQVSTRAPRIRDRAPDVAVSARVEGIVARCLEKDPSARFQSMEELEAALAAAEQTGPSRPATRTVVLEDTLPTQGGPTASPDAVATRTAPMRRSDARARPDTPPAALERAPAAGDASASLSSSVHAGAAAGSGVGVRLRAAWLVASVIVLGGAVAAWSFQRAPSPGSTGAAADVSATVRSAVAPAVPAPAGITVPAGPSMPRQGEAGSQEQGEHAHPDDAPTLDPARAAPPSTPARAAAAAAPDASAAPAQSAAAASPARAAGTSKRRDTGAAAEQPSEPGGFVRVRTRETP